MDKIINTINRADNALERLKSGCMWVFLNLVWMILLGVAVYVGRGSWELKQEGSSVTGTVVSLREVDETDNTGVTYAPVINYDVQGRTYTYESSNSSDPPAYEVGEKVTLLYRPENPEEVRVNTWFDLWFLPAMLGGGGVVVAIVSIVMMVSSIRRRRQLRTA
jgi:hypothetical protein